MQEDPKYKAPSSSKASKVAAGSGSGFGRAIGGGTKGSSLVTAELKKLTPQVHAHRRARDCDRRDDD